MPDCPGNLAAIEDLLQDALAAHQNDEWQRAEELYRMVLAECPEYPEARCYLGLLYQASGRIDEAIALLEEARRQEPPQAELYVELGNLYRQRGDVTAAMGEYQAAMALAPRYAPAYYNLGVVAFAAGRTEDAIAAYREAVRLDSADADAVYNLAIAYAASGNSAEAIRCYGRALRLAPDDPDILYNLGLLHEKLEDIVAAVHCFEQVAVLDSGYAPAYSHLGALYAKLEQPHEAAACFERLVELDHDTKAARHMLAALRGDQVEASPPEYVQNLFDRYAASFEEELIERLDYNAPMLLRQLAGEVLPPGGRFERVLDLGCGTGLAGEAFRSIAGRLVGVDLSTGMIARARQKSVYDELVAGDIITFCRQQPGRYNCIIAADVLVYLGDLEPLFAAVAERVGTWRPFPLFIGNGNGPGGTIQSATHRPVCPCHLVSPRPGRTSRSCGQPPETMRVASGKGGMAGGRSPDSHASRIAAYLPNGQTG